MSLGSRATKGGAKGAKDGKHAQDTRKPTDKTQNKEKIKPQATTEQLRMAHMIDRKSEDASDVRRMVLELMEMTCRTEEEVCSALHDSDNDMVAACNLLLEETQRIQGEWQTSEKKKKKPAATGNGDVEPPRDPRSRSGPRHGSGRGAGEERGGGGRGRGGGRGGRGAARGGRGGPSRRARPARAPPSWAPDHSGGNPDSFPNTEDWDNEEWSGSLSDTKVFTPSVNAQNVVPETDATPANTTTEDWDAGEVSSYTYHNAQHLLPTHTHRDLSGSGSGQSPEPSPAPPDAPYVHHHHQPMGMSGSLSAAQSQYLSQLTQQTQRHDNSVYTSTYGVYAAGDATQRKPQRARVPPPSKIPSSAVEMPGGAEMFLDVQFGALDPDSLQETHKPVVAPVPVPEPAPVPVTSHSHDTYNTNNILSEKLSHAAEAAPSSPTHTPHNHVAPEPVVTVATTSLEATLSASMKQLSVSASDSAPQPAALTQHRPKASATQAVYAGATPHAPVYNANVYAPQVNSTNASLTGAVSALGGPAYPSSVTLTQYQPIMNSYQTSSSAAPYGGSALYTAAPYAYTQQQHKLTPKDNHQYDNSVASSNSLTNTTTTQTSTAKVATTTVVAGVGSTGGYAGGALYGAAPYAPYDDQLMRSTLPHHMGGYYEVGYGGREGAFGLSAGERFGRTDAASPQQVPTAALPPGYAYFTYQPPPTTYQYGVYPTYGGGSNVAGVSGVGSVGGAKVSSYAPPQQPPYDAQDSYKQAGPYSGGAGKAGGGAAAEQLGNAIYAKPHVALNKVNSYEKASFHSGTPPPFGGASHLYIPAPPHHHPHHHAHQESGAGGRPSGNKPAASKPNYSQSYWAPN